MKVKLTPSVIAKATCPAGKEREIWWDATMPGFGYQVTSKNAHSFVVQYRSAGRSHRMAIDGVLTLDKARREARVLLGQVAQGGDPLGERRRDKAATADTFEAIANEYHKREGKDLRTRAWRVRVLERLVFPVLGARAIGDIRRTDIVRLLDTIEDENGPVMADRTLSIVRKVMNWHASRSDDFRSPIVAGMMRTKASELARERVLTDDELRVVWEVAEATQGPFGAYVRFVLLTGTRRNEAAQMVWSEVEAGDWLIPGSRYKSGADHLIPLSAKAQEVLAGIPRIEGCDHVFTVDGRKPMGGLSRAKRRLDAACGVTGWTTHDLRRTARTLLSRVKVPNDHAERCLGHTMGGVRGIYDRHAYHAEKQAAFEALAAEIDRITGGNIVPLRRVAED